jgi:hypothetical protein
VPDKAQRQYNFCVFPRGGGTSGTGTGTGPSAAAAAAAAASAAGDEAIVWTVPDAAVATAGAAVAGALVEGSGGGDATFKPPGQPGPGQPLHAVTYKVALIAVLNAQLAAAAAAAAAAKRVAVITGTLGVIEPDEKGFASAVAQPHRKGEKAVHVKAFRGSKDGMFVLFLL